MSAFGGDLRPEERETVEGRAARHESRPELLALLYPSSLRKDEKQISNERRPTVAKLLATPNAQTQYQTLAAAAAILGWAAESTGRSWREILDQIARSQSSS